MASKVALRRYPALGFLAVAAALALLLPSRLTNPRSEPASLAEFAPVPGESEGTEDMSELVSARSGAEPASRRRAPPTPGVEDEAKLDGRSRDATTKRCEGTPPRQTEDPLSPPCVAFFSGDNGGKTAKGVDRDEVRVGMFVDPSNSTNGTVTDCAEPPAPGDIPEDLACKAFSRFFYDRYQTYGRRVRMWTYHIVSTGAALSIPGAVGSLDERFDLFGAVAGEGTIGSPVGRAAADRGILSVLFSGTFRGYYRQKAPYIISFRPDREDAIGIASDFVCSKLRGLPPRSAGVGVDTTAERVFGIWAEESYADAMAAALRACGARVAAVVDITPPGANHPGEAARLRTAGVSTVVISGPNGNTNQATQAAAAQAGSRSGSSLTMVLSPAASARARPRERSTALSGNTPSVSRSTCAGTSS